MSGFPPAVGRWALVFASVGVLAAATEAGAGAGAERAWQARQAEEAERRRSESLLRAYELRRSAAHARMPSTMHASTPVGAARGDYSCPVLPVAAEEAGPFARRRPSGASARMSPVPGRPFLVPAPRSAALRVRQAPVARTAAPRAVGGMGTGVAGLVRAEAFAVGDGAEHPGAGLIRASAVGDFNGDGKDDVLLRHGDGRWRYYAMDGRTAIADESGPADMVADPAWAFAGAGDFNGDGRDDVLLRHADGGWRYYAMDGRTPIADESGPVDIAADPEWSLAGVGDFDGDGKEDVLLRHADLSWRYHPMDGREVLDGGGSANLTRNPGWRIAGIGDLDGDGKDDVLLRKDTGAWYYYPMDGRRYVSGRQGGAGLTGKAEYRLAGIGDFGGDGKEDVLLRRDDGLWYYYPMDGREILDGRGAANLTRNAEWSLGGIGDFDGDGKDDVLLRKRDTTGTWYYYPMDGRRYASGRQGAADLTADLSWKLAGEAEAAFKDCAACPQMIRVPAGGFSMGSPSSESGRSEDEGPAREVEFAESFAIGVREVTFAEWEACAADGGCGGHVPPDWGWGGGDVPVTDVTWEQARSYADWLSEETGEHYRLPSEAEWEYAARAGTATPFHTGETISTDQANYDGTLPPYGEGETGENRGRPAAVGSFPANGFGLRDTHGNAAEWTADCWAADYGGAPSDGRARESEGCAERAVRGGSWRDAAVELRSANRDWREDGAHSDALGFRVARGAPPAPEPTAAELFEESISPIVQSKCVNCHVAGGVSGNTRLVFARETDAEHLSKNLSVFETFLAEVEDGAELILNKIQGVGHGGGVQAAAGTDDYAAMERFLALLGEEVGPAAITPETLFDGVKLAPLWQVLRRAALIFAGRVPTAEEYAALRDGGGPAFRPLVRDMMQGPGFHEFLIRAGNDRLLTDRDGTIIDAAATDDFVDFSNLYHEKAISGTVDVWRWFTEVQYGIRRAPLELIAHVAKNELPYTEALTADYIMANSLAAEAYGASTTFDDASDLHEFQPSEIVSYYRDGPSKVSEYSLQFGTKVTNPGDLITDYPHAGILNTTVFLHRYPTTATNRNRARSRWTYYQFLGLDVEKSAARTTDPVALADTNNPTMYNPACTVCHSVLDPVAGAFQNYGDEGFYRDQGGGLDSLDAFYKDGDHNAEFRSIEARSWEERETVTVEAWLAAGPHTVALATRSKHNIHVDYLAVRDAAGVEQKQELEDSDDQECGSAWTGNTYELIHCPLVVEIEVPEDGEYVVETAAYVGYDYDEVQGRAAKLAIWVPYDKNYQEGDTWYRDMRAPGFDGELVTNAENSLQWLAERIVEDDRFAEATVKFWWPAIMGSEVAEPPEDESDADFEGLLLASSAQAAEVERLARGFQRGFHGRQPYNLKDLLIEIVLSRWFRADSVADEDPVRAVALTHAGARRLLTPEEMARKTLALTGFQWGRDREGSQPWRSPLEQRWSSLTDSAHGYGLLYGGIDSDGVTERARNLTSVMASVAQSHAAESSCPVVMKEFYLLPDEDRRLFDGIDPAVSPVSEFGRTFEIAAASRSEREMLSLEGRLRAGPITISLAYLNDFWDEELGDRDILLDRLTVYRGRAVVHRLEMEDFDHPDCNHIEQDAFHLSGSGAECVLSVPVDIPRDGTYRIEVTAWGDQAGDELPMLAVTVESDAERSAGSAAIRAKLVDLYDRLHGVRVTADSPDVRGAYDLFVDVWRRRQESDDVEFYGWNDGIDCHWPSDQHYFDGIADRLWREELDEHGNEQGWDWDAIGEYFGEIGMSDPRGVAETWTVVLAYLLMDYRYLYL